MNEDSIPSPTLVELVEALDYEPAFLQFRELVERAAIEAKKEAWSARKIETRWADRWADRHGNGMATSWSAHVGSVHVEKSTARDCLELLVELMVKRGYL